MPRLLYTVKQPLRYKINKSGKLLDLLIDSVTIDIEKRHAES